MSAAIATTPPLQLTAGDTATWKISLPDYSAAEGWVLSYRFIKRTGGVNFTVTATASGADHLISEPAANSSVWLPGTYDVQAYVTKTTDRFQVWQGAIVIRQNYQTAEDALDTRSKARKTFDALEDAILTVSTAQNSGTGGGIVEWTIEGAHIKKLTPDLLLAELTRQRDRYAAIVRNEDDLLARQSGRATGRRVLTRFVCPR